MKRALIGLCVTLTAAPAFAQNDEAIPYDDDKADSSNLETGAKKKKRPRRDERFREDDDDAKTRDETLTHLAPLFSFGARFTWEFGRLIPDEYLREMFFADVRWQFAQSTDGTTEVHSTSTQHSFTVAPAFAIPLGDKSPISVYGQVGAGLNANFTSLIIDRTETPITGTKFLFQYGLGLRGRPAIIDSGALRISFRIELTRYLRGYMSDTFIGAGCGIVF